MENKTIQINLEFFIIVSITLLVLGMNFYNQYGEKIQSIFNLISYWFVIGVAVGVLALAVIYNLRVYWKIIYVLS